MSNRLYVIRSIDDPDKGILGVVASSIGKAKRIGMMRMEIERWTDIGCRLFSKEHNIDITKEGVIDQFEGVRNRVYEYIDDICPICKSHSYIHLHDDIVCCDDCMKQHKS